MYTCKLDPTNLNCEKDNPKNYDGVFAWQLTRSGPSDPHGNVARKTPWARGYVSFDPPRLVRHAGRARQEYGLVQFENGGEAQNACPGHRYCGLAGRGHGRILGWMTARLAGAISGLTGLRHASTCRLRGPAKTLRTGKHCGIVYVRCGRIRPRCEKWYRPSRR